MHKSLLWSLAFALLLAGCANEHPAQPVANKAASASQPTTMKKISVSGFDPEGEPEIRVMSDGTLLVVFNFMPPSHAEDEEEKYADFDKQLEKALGVPVEQEDREFFLIRKPAEDTAEKARTFLEGYRKTKRE